MSSHWENTGIYLEKYDESLRRGYDGRPTATYFPTPLWKESSPPVYVNKLTGFWSVKFNFVKGNKSAGSWVSLDLP